MPVEDQLYPVNLRVAGRRCLVVGGGPVAAEKIRGLLDAHAVVDVIAEEVGQEVAALGVPVRARAYRSGDLAGYRLAITATDDPDVNRRVYLDGEEAGVWVNSADDVENCAFILPSRVRRGPLLVTFSTHGRSPALARWLRRRFEVEIGPEYETLVGILEEARDEWGRVEPSRWQNALDSGMLELVREGRIAEAKELLHACLSSSSD